MGDIIKTSHDFNLNMHTRIEYESAASAWIAEKNKTTLVQFQHELVNKNFTMRIDPLDLHEINDENLVVQVYRACGSNDVHTDFELQNTPRDCFPIVHRFHQRLRYPEVDQGSRAWVMLHKSDFKSDDQLNKLLSIGHAFYPFQLQRYQKEGNRHRTQVYPNKYHVALYVTVDLNQVSDNLEEYIVYNEIDQDLIIQVHPRDLYQLYEISELLPKHISQLIPKQSKDRSVWDQDEYDTKSFLVENDLDVFNEEHYNKYMFPIKSKYHMHKVTYDGSYPPTKNKNQDGNCDVYVRMNDQRQIYYNGNTVVSPDTCSLVSHPDGVPKRKPYNLHNIRSHK